MTTTIPAMPRLSTLICDPFVRAAFERAERRRGSAAVVSARRPRTLNGGTAESIPAIAADKAATAAQSHTKALACV
jgi:hypothetical protein